MSDSAPPAPSLVEQQIRVHPFTSGLPEADAAALAVRAELVEFAPFDVIFEAGGVADRFYLVRTGVVALEVMTESGRATQIQALSEGSVLGWSWLFPPYEWQFRAVAETPVRAIAVDAEALRDSCQSDPAFGFRLVRRIAEVMADRLHASRRRLIDL